MNTALQHGPLCFRAAKAKHKILSRAMMENEVQCVGQNLPQEQPCCMAGGGLKDAGLPQWCQRETT